MGNCWGSKSAELVHCNTNTTTPTTITTTTTTTIIAATTGPFTPGTSNGDSNDVGFSSSSPNQSQFSVAASDDTCLNGEILPTPNLKVYTFADLKSATRNFKSDTVLGIGGFGTVFKGWVDEKTLAPSKFGAGMIVAIKKLSHESVQGFREWQAAQKNYLAHERMIAARQNLRDAITENKILKGDVDVLKAEQEVLKAERDEIRQKLDRAEEDKNKAVKKSKARYLAELRKLRDAHKTEKDQAVDEAEDRGYAQGEKTYERQVRATKDIFFQCGWKAAVEKVGLGRDSEMFINPPTAHIPDYMQAYASETQDRLIAEAKKEAEEEAAAQKQAEHTAEQTPSDASPNAEGGAIDRVVDALVVSDIEAEDISPEQTMLNAELTVEESEQNLALD